MKDRKVTEKDVRILRVLKENARASIRQISKRTRMKPSTVHKRLSDLMEDGIIRRFTVDIDEKALGVDLTVYMLISGTLDTYIDKELLGSEHIVELIGITGEYDMLMKLKFRDMDEFNRFVIDFRARYAASIHKTVTMVETVRLKAGGPPL